ncbi:hypothetical protein G3I19_11040 [Streptomyces sp. SID10853]|uniref:hypothetical protein n=1 Tax=Streptomyces sp. SID10853 TaxID=2706028 RepID=UPI0013BFEFAE|nr:hypothetical protein [Streptomyces sp. SID10853]NDZ79048.1 hypothetical protein [Streptomyces sp. SID10853]
MSDAEIVDLPKIVARRVGDGWALEIDGIEATYVRRLDGAIEQGCALLEAASAPAEHGAQLQIDLGDELNQRVKEATQATVDAHKAQIIAAAELRQTATALSERGITGRDIAQILGVSPQRVSQLLKK